SDERAGTEQAPRVLNRHVVLAEMHAIGSRGQRHVEAVVDDERHTKRSQRLFDGARRCDHGARLAVLVAQLHERGAAFGGEPRQFGKIAAAGALGIDDGIEPQIDAHHATLMRARKVARSRPCSASMMALAKLPGPAAPAPASSPAMPSAPSAATAASQASLSTASAAPSSAEPAQPMAVTRPISGWPLRIAVQRLPSVTRSMSPVSATTVPESLAACAAASSEASPPNSGTNSDRLSRTTAGRRANSVPANAARPGERSMNTGSSTHGMRAASAAPRAASMAARRSASKVPRLTRSASADATKAAISSGEMVIDGTAPAASSTLAV